MRYKHYSFPASESNSQLFTEVTCHLTHTDFKDEHSQTLEITKMAMIDQEVQTEDIVEEDSFDIKKKHTDNFQIHSCPNLNLLQNNLNNVLADESRETSSEENINFDLDQLKYCLETDIVDDFVML